MATALNQDTAKPLRNHCKANVQSLRHLQEKMRDQKVLAAQQKSEDARRWKMKQFENVKPRLREDPEKLREDREEQREKAREMRESLRAQKQSKSPSPHDGPRRVKTPHASGSPNSCQIDDGPSYPGGDTEYLRGGAAPCPNLKPMVPRSRECTHEPSANKPITRNFVSENRRGAQELHPGHQPKEFDDTQLKSFQKLQNGVPAYLNDIKGRLAEEKRKASQVIEIIPAGYRLMGEAEKKETLESLAKKKSEAEAAWRKLPLKIETEGQRRRQQQIQNEIKDCEKMTALFDKPRVLVEM